MRDLASLRVCFLAGTLGQGGAEQQLFHIVSTLKKAGTTVVVLSFSQNEFWEDRLRALQVAVHCVGESRSQFLRLGKILRFLGQYRPSILQSCHFHMNLYAVIAGKVLGIREVGALRSDAISEVNRVGGKLGYWSLVLPRLVAANSSQAIANAIGLGAQPRRLCLLRNVLDCMHYCPASNQAVEPVRLLWVGRLSPDKRPDRFLSTFAEVSRQVSQPLNALIVGDGPLRNPLERQAASLGLLPGTVEFAGTLPDLRSAYRRSHVLVLTSDREGSPNVILEAMACGLPVVSTRVGGVPELVEDGQSGFLSAPGDEGAMAEALRKLACDASVRYTMGLKGRDYVTANHSLDKLIIHLERLYALALV